MTVLLIALGAAIGAPLRYLVDRLIQARHDSVFPWGTLSVNILGTGLLGFLSGLPTPGSVMAFAGIGLAGALTTYSTFGYETLRLAQNGARLLAALNPVVSIVAGLGAGLTGFLLAQVLTG